MNGKLPNKMESEDSLQEKHELLMNHIILPRYLPQSKPNDRHHEERELMSQMIENVNELSAWIPENTVNMFASLDRILRSCTPEMVAHEIRSLKPGHTFAMFVRRQNCALMIHMPKNDDNMQTDRVIVATFPGNLHPKYVYSGESDIEFNYPVQALKVPFSNMIRSEDFAYQLCYLYQELPIDKNNRNYVSKWLVTLLADAASETVNPDEYPIITKKIRDETLGEGNSDFFRRSSFYMCAKVFLQHSLTLELGPEKAKVLYKIVMLNFLTNMINFFEKSLCKALNIDLMSQAIAKLARRIEKMDQLKCTEFNHLQDQTMFKAKKTIEKIRQKIDKQIDALEKHNEEMAELSPLIGIDVEADVIQKTPKLREYLESRNSEKVPNRFGSMVQIKPINRHYMMNLNSPNVHSFGQISNEIENNLLLSDFENWILYVLEIDANSYGSDIIRTWSDSYTLSAEKFYKDDQLGSSKMILVRLKLIVMLDLIACQKHSMLRNHRTGIDPKVIECLLLPQQTDMEIATEIEKYFTKRNAAASDPSLFEQTNVTIKSFSAKFAEQDEKMQQVLADLLNIEAEGIKAKKIEWRNGREKVASLRRSLPFSCSTFTNHCGRTYHDRYCKKCQLETVISSVKIEQYERPLPEHVYEQNAIVFELNPPIEIACLRDVLCEFSTYCSGKTCENASIVGHWIQYSQIKRFNKSNSKRVHLGSTTISSLHSYHVDQPFDWFVVKHGYNCKLFHVENKSNKCLPPQITHEHIKVVCTLQTEAEHEGLQWTLNGNQHTQNQVIARQNECPHGLSLFEFKHFGSLRADGHRMQLFKLYSMIDGEALSFEKPSVLSLIIQTLWEVGVSDDAGSIREPHEDFQNSKIAEAMIDMLDNYCTLQKSNWVHPLKLLMSALIAVRVFEFNEHSNHVDHIVKLLNKIRSIALEWIGKIEAAIKDIQVPNVEIEQDLRMKLVIVSIAGAATFFVHSTHAYFDRIFVENVEKQLTASRIWLQFIVTLNNNVLLNANQNEMPLNLRLLLRLVRNIGIHIEPTIKTKINLEPNIVYELVKQQWTRADSAHFERYEFSTKCPQVFLIHVNLKGIINHVTLDIVTGRFLVNNLPVARLPNNITRSIVFTRVFDTFIFEVQPDSQSSFSAVHKYNGCNYEFRRLANSTIIIEKCEGTEKELIPHTILDGEIPQHLIENYTHFWNKTDNTIEFRTKMFKDSNFSKEDGIEYRLNLNEARLIEIKTQRYMIDINSNSYLKIVKQLSRLESSKFIHVLMDEPRIAKAELIRMRLKFVIDCTIVGEEYEIISNEYSRMRVSLAQTCGTLYGLHHGLLLESIPPDDRFEEKRLSKVSTKLLLMPHGDIQTSQINSHVSVAINIESDMRNPPFHVYEVDEFCRQLKANNSNYSSWFYLAYLHAVTSHGEIEPFIKMSGTERALQILQSGFVWSSSPYDEEATKMLHAIAHLTPKRNVNDSWQKVTWPDIIPSRSAQDTFIFIAQRLIEDSQRLHGLYGQKEVEQLKFETQLNQNLRQYLRYLPFAPNVKVSEAFMQHTKLKTSPIELFHMNVSPQIQTVSILYHRQAYNVPKNLNLQEFLLSKRDLAGMVNYDTVPSLLNHQNYQDFENLWISLYEYARHGKLNDEQFALIWSVLTHDEKSFAPILALQTVQMNKQIFRSINPPPVERYLIHKGTYNAQEVSSILNRYHTVPSEFYDDDFNQTTYNQDIRHAIEYMTGIVSGHWPCNEIDLVPYCTTKHINSRAASVTISQNLKIWNDNRKLEIFIEKVQTTLYNLNASIFVQTPQFNSLAFPTPLKWQQFEIDFKKKMCENVDKFTNILYEANQIWTGNSEPTKSADSWWSIYEEIVNQQTAQHLINAGMYPRAVPSFVLPEIVSKNNGQLKTVIGALAITIAFEQRQKRIDIFAQHNQFKAAMQKEKENKSHVNWKPCDYPEWLLFEIEQNLTIRKIQVDVAKHMMQPSNSTKKHSVMQLNMGEGKTAVIVPIIAAVLANGQQACQITVLKSLFATNLKLYRRYLGGMLNRRLYVFPCRRDMPIAGHIAQLMNIYEECKEMKGVILTTPEWRLSFQLKTYESVQNADFKSAAHFLSIHNWINANVRSILDESDAILHAKYQLIYTLGQQSSPDGGTHRWTIIQAVLKRVPDHMKRLHDDLGEEKIEFDKNYVENGHVYGSPHVNYRSDVFTPCRILDATAYDVLKSYLIEDFLDGKIAITFPEMLPSIKECLRHLLSEKCIDKAQMDEILSNFTVGERNIIMILSGLLRFEVLKLILLRRWRVNYGVKENGMRSMAIPFKAKDVAADMTEFGHLDVALCFTHLSYYYSGLSDEQLKQTFDMLSTFQNATEIYEKWSHSVSSKLIDASIRSYTGVNLSDPHQRDELLFPVYRFNMNCIDFYLSNFVFPREARTFEKKLMCTAWDLCSEHMNHTVTGFSGTNDTKNILPLSIAQNDLAQLESTNENVRQTLLRDENQSYQNLPANVSAKEIIERLIESEIAVLLDAGALMLELNNLQVAEYWLATTSEHHYDAAIYFDSRDIMQTIDRNGITTEFDCSVYRENLHRCLVYLDDVHTRGTDLKFPPNWRACVTLSGDITRDKTVQACMRMRQLGKDGGHSIAFWASFEADIKIRELCEFALPHNCVPNDHVIEFICKNSEAFETENTVHWAAGAYNYTNKLIGHKLCDKSTDEASLKSLSDICIENEYVKLEEVYGDKEETLLVDIAQSRFDKLIDTFKNNQPMISFIQTVKEAVHAKILKQAPNVKRFVQALDEEQEKEMEREREEERHIERPDAMSPAAPQFDKTLKQLISSGATPDIMANLIESGTIVSLAKGLENTKLIKNYGIESKMWSKHLYITKDCVTVLSNKYCTCDEYLRPVWWIARVNAMNDDHIIVILSSFECDRLKTTFKESDKAVLFMYRSRLSKLNDNLLHHPSLYITSMADIQRVDIYDEVQIGMFAGSMYFKSEDEQNAYCKVLGLIPRPRSKDQEQAFEEGIITRGFVSPQHRNYSSAISEAIDMCQFDKNPIDLAMDLVKAHHHFVREESHVASILERGFKMDINKK